MAIEATARVESFGLPDDGLKNVTAVVHSVKKPPPESRGSIRTRTLVILSFWAVVVLLGLPLWLWTTSIHRAKLPLQEMLAWADGKACKPIFPLHIIIDAPLLQENEAQHLVRTTQHALDDLNEFSAHHLRLTLGRSLAKNESQEQKDSQEVMSEQEKDEVALTVVLSPSETATAAITELRPHSVTLDVFYPSNQIPSISSSSSPLASTIAASLQDLFAEEQASIAHILASSTPNGNGHSVAAAIQSSSASARERAGLSRASLPDIATTTTRRTTGSLKYAATYHVTISLFTSGASPSDWDIEAAVDQYLAPLLGSFTISNFTVDTQVQLYASFSPSLQAPEYDSEHQVWTLHADDLSGFINAAEWPLGPSIGDGPTLNFILYVPDAAVTPLVVRDSLATSWLIPQWGGVTILNHRADIGAARLSLADIRPALLVCAHQLLALLGAPAAPPASFALQLQTLTRVRAASLLLSASGTLGSLARLTGALRAIAIPETVAAGVERSLANLRRACELLREGRFTAALDHARVAESEAERGFFEKSMVGQVYFPDEHKVAVYLPLLGPMGVPLVMSAIKEFKRWIAARRG